MPAIHQPHTTDQELPNILVFGDSYPLIPQLIHLLLSSTRIVHITKQALNTSPDSTYTFVKHIDSDLISRVKDNLAYALFLLQDDNDKKCFQDILPKLETDKTKTLIIIPINQVDTMYDVILAHKNHPFISFYILGDLFDVSLQESGSFSELLINAVSSKHIVLTGNDLTPIYPLSLSDCLEYLQFALFGDHKKSRVVILSYDQPQNIISLTYSLRTLEPELDVRFEDESNNSKLSRKTHQELLSELYSKTQLHAVYIAGIHRFELMVKKLLQSHQRSKTLVPQPEKSKKRPRKQDGKLAWLFHAFVISFLIFLLINILATGIGLYLSKKSLQQLIKGEYTHAQENASYSLKLLTISQPVLEIGSMAIEKVQPNSTIVSHYRLLQSALDVADLSLNTILPQMQKIPKGMSEEELDILISAVFTGYFQLEQLSVYNSTLASKLAIYQEAQYVSTLSVLPEILGYTDKRTYLLLFQNNGELRPNGGFVGSVGELTIEKGKVTSFRIRDVYELDGQLKAHVEPHYIVRRYLQPHLYLRDSTFDLDFQDSAKKSADIYFQETGITVDGVIGIDFEVLKRIIESIGPINLPSYNITLTGENTFSFLQDTIEKDTFPGSSSKKDVLNTVFNQILLSVENNDKKKVLIAQHLPKLLLEKHILFAFRNNSTQQIFTANSLAGSIPKLSQPTDNSEVHDIFSLNEANIGVNKANTHVTREVSYKATLKEQAIDSLAELTFENKYDKEYRTYFRILAPQNAKVSSITIDGKEQKITSAVIDFEQYESKSFTPPVGLEVDTTEYKTYTTFGFVTTIPAKKSQQILIAYTTPTSALPTSYSLLVIKQPGISPLPFDATVVYPSSLAPLSSTKGRIEKSSVSFSEEILSDYTFSIDFISKP